MKDKKSSTSPKSSGSELSEPSVFYYVITASKGKNKVQMKVQADPSSSLTGSIPNKMYNRIVNVFMEMFIDFPSKIEFEMGER